MATNPSNDLYNKILDTFIILRDVSYEFKTYSANDIKNLIESKLKAKKREPKALQHLYELEKSISEIRDLFVKVKILQEPEPEPKSEPSKKDE